MPDNASANAAVNHAWPRGPLKFCGVSPVAVREFRQVRASTSARREAWLVEAWLAEYVALGRGDAAG